MCYVHRSFYRFLFHIVPGKARLAYWMFGHGWLYLGRVHGHPRWGVWPSISPSRQRVGSVWGKKFKKLKSRTLSVVVWIALLHTKIWKCDILNVWWFVCHTGFLWKRSLGSLLPAHRTPDDRRLQDVEISEEFHHYKRCPGKEYRWHIRFFLNV